MVHMTNSKTIARLGWKFWTWGCDGVVGGYFSIGLSSGIRVQQVLTLRDKGARRGEMAPYLVVINSQI